MTDDTVLAADRDAFERARDALFARGPGRMIPDLARITELTGLLGDPQLAYPTVHVTGTNGKGSTVRMVASLCAAVGISAGTYTSPHLQSIRERIGRAGEPIDPGSFARVHDEVAVIADLLDERARASGDAEPDTVTFFEMLTAMAFAWFADAPVDVGVVEVGMGGRWDATNVVRGDVAVLNEIDLDHTELGGTPVEVAGEKVGIVKPGSHVVTSRQTDEVAAVIASAAREHDATLWRLGHEFDVTSDRVAMGGRFVDLRVGERVVTDVMVPLYGAHQARNAAVSLAAFAGFTGESFTSMDDDVLREGFAAVEVPGRLEVVHREPTIVLDGAHNPLGARAVAAALEESFGFRELVLVVACLEEKDVVGILSELRTVASHVIVTRADSPRAMDVAGMHAAALEVWESTGVAVEAADSVADALDLATNLVSDGDGILVTGSLHTVGEARARHRPVDDA
ncbi:MAG: cyanophycin synthetase [Nitriliruptoraceae bacterium]